MNKIFAGIIATAILLHISLPASGSLDIDPHSPLPGTSFTIKQSIDYLAAFDCFTSLLKGDSLKTEREIVRLIQQTNLCAAAEETPELAKQLIQALRQKFLPPVKWSHIGAWWPQFRAPRFNIKYLYHKDDGRPASHPRVTATVSPWTANRDGISLRPGHNAILSSHWAFSLGKWLDFDIDPVIVSNKQDSFYITPLKSTLKLTFGNFEIKSGRSHLYWGQGFSQHTGTVLFGNNARPMEMIQIGNPLPTTLPWIFKHLGPFHYRLSLANLDKNQLFPNPYLLSGRIMFKPTKNFEMAFTRSLVFGGSGAPDFFVLEPVLELLGFRPQDGWIFNIPFKPGARGGNAGFANNVFGFDFNLRFPSWRNTELYFELYNEDPFDPLDFFPEDSIIRLGFWAPRLSWDGQWQMQAEASYAAKIVYSHSRFKSGFTNQNRILGLDSGAKTARAHIRLTKLFSSKAQVWGLGEFWLAFPNNDNSIRKEYRFISRAGGTYLITDTIRFHAATGLQFIKNFNFLTGNKVSPMAEIGFELTL